jgi:hypothetical protein
MIAIPPALLGGDRAGMRSKAYLDDFGTEHLSIGMFAERWGSTAKSPPIAGVVVQMDPFIVHRLPRPKEGEIVCVHSISINDLKEFASEGIRYSTDEIPRGSQL